MKVGGLSSQTKKQGQDTRLNSSLNMSYQRQEQEKVRLSNSQLLHSLQNIKPTINREEWRKHSKKVGDLHSG